MKCISYYMKQSRMEVCNFMFNDEFNINQNSHNPILKHLITDKKSCQCSFHKKKLIISNNKNFYFFIFLFQKMNLFADNVL